MTPAKHSQISLRRWGGCVEDYHAIHEFIDSTKALCADGRHRILHTHWALDNIVIPIFGRTFTNSSGKKVYTKELCEIDHFLPDFANQFIPTLGDFTDALPEISNAGITQRIEAFHSEFAQIPSISKLLLSPLGVTGRMKSLLFTHNSWFINTVLPMVYPAETAKIHLINFDLTPADVFIPMNFELWMDNGAARPPSARSVGTIEQLRKLRTSN